MNSHFHDLKAQMKTIHDTMRIKLKKLTIDSDEVMCVVKEKSEKAKQILQFAEMCRKMETEEEKVLPFYASTLTDEEESDVKQAIMEAPSQQLAVVCYI